MNDLLETLRPWSPEAERATCSAILNDAGRALAAVETIVSRADFFDERHALIFGAAQELAARRAPVDVVTVFDFLQTQGSADRAGGLVYLSQLQGSGYGSARAAAYAQLVQKFSRRRRLLALLDEAQDRAADPGADPQEALDATTTKLLDLQRSTVGQQARSATEIALARLDHWEALAAGKARSGWPTHHTRLNGMLGGLRPGALYYFAARPAVGKSSFALELAARSGLKSLFLSLEMAADELIDRAVAGLGRVAYSALQTGRLRDDGGGGSDWGRVAEAVGSPGMRLLFIDDQPALTLSQIRAKAKSVPGLQLLVLDYLQLCSGSAGPGANRNAEIEQISRGLKALAKELGIAVVALSQLNRGVEARTDKRPMLADLRDSGSIEQDADSVLMLWTARELPDGQRVVGLSVAKNRHGRTGTLALRFDGEHQSWAESDDDLTPSAAPRGLGGFRDGD